MDAKPSSNKQPLPDDIEACHRLIGYDEVERLVWQRAELRVEVVKYAKYANPTDKSQGVVNPESIRTYRQDERRQAADRKRVRRARRRKLQK